MHKKLLWAFVGPILMGSVCDVQGTDLTGGSVPEAPKKSGFYLPPSAQLGTKYRPSPLVLKAEAAATRDVNIVNTLPDDADFLGFPGQNVPALLVRSNQPLTWTNEKGRFDVTDLQPEYILWGSGEHTLRVPASALITNVDVLEVNQQILKALSTEAARISREKSQLIQPTRLFAQSVHDLSAKQGMHHFFGRRIFSLPISGPSPLDAVLTVFKDRVVVEPANASSASSSSAPQ